MIFRRKKSRVDPEALDKQTAEVREFLENEKPRMSAVAEFLNNRRGQNGLGEDFDITFYPRSTT
jgi:hypothetical protein